MAKLLDKFLGKSRWQALSAALRTSSSITVEPQLGVDALFVALLLSVTPIALTFWDSARPPGAPSSPLPTLGFGICTLLAFVTRSRLGLPFVRTADWRKSLSLTHTAVALGCIPAALILVISKTLLSDRHDTLTRAVGGASSGSSLGIAGAIGLVLAIAAWVAVTEEMIFRGTLVSVVRRLRFIPKQWQRDTAAGVLSAVIFGLAHWPTWGPLPALALVGLGLGFVVGYLANGEQLLPLILYHFVFDTLSIGISLFGIH
ncbi:MAG: CPBP family intramembrane glutamic endopeptidase [Bdellovibrionota bacterium]